MLKISENSARLVGLFIVVTVAITGCIRTTQNPPPFELNGQTKLLSTLHERIRVLENQLQAYQAEQRRLQEALATSTQNEAKLETSIRKLEKQVKQIEARLAELADEQAESRLSKIESLYSKLEQTEAELDKARQQSEAANLNSLRLQDLLAREKSEHDSTKRNLSSEIHKYGQDLSVLQDRVQRLQAESEHKKEAFSEQTDRLETRIQELEAEASNQAPEGEPDFSVRAKNTSLQTVTVFYGTNRERLGTGVLGAFAPLILPVLLLVSWFLTPAVIRVFVKEQLQPGMIRGIRVALAIGIGYFGLTGLQAGVLQWQDSHRLEVQYGPGRMEAAVDGLPYELGTTVVSIPPIHQRGEVETPELIYLEFYSDSTKHFVVNKISPHEDREFFAELRTRVENSDRKDMFVFVHGFHNTFQDAAFRTAQIAHDLDFAGAPVFFSWPSQGAVLDYPADENNVGASIQDLKHFLENLRQNSDAQKIHLIAHSMGNRALTEAVKELGLENPGSSLFNEVVLAAPDMDAKTLRDITPGLTAAAERVTLYASSRDRALIVSRKFHGGEHPRAGESQPAPLTSHPMESIDVSSVSGGHSYISDNGRVLTDLRELLNASRTLNDSMADPVADADGGVYWVMRAAM